MEASPKVSRQIRISGCSPESALSGGCLLEQVGHVWEGGGAEADLLEVEMEEGAAGPVFFSKISWWGRCQVKFCLFCLII